MKKIILPMALLSVFALEARNASAPVAPVACGGCEFSGGYVGAGITGHFARYGVEAISLPGHPSHYSRANRVAGSIVLGAGKTLANSAYVGAEAMGDFTKSSTNSAHIAGAPEYKVRKNGVLPSVGVRVGYNCCDKKALAYVKVGATWLNNRVLLGANKAKMRKVTPNLAVGVEKKLCGKFAARLEGEFAFNAKKNLDVNGTPVKMKDKGAFNIRALTSYHI